MRYAIFSDLHANRQAWAAVREDIARSAVDVLICLGDVVGYGPKPQEVLESVYEETQNFVLGNHDAVIAGRLDPEIFNDHARAVIEWTRQQLNEDARQFFAEVPMTIQGAGFLAVHAEAAQPGRFSYIVDAEDARPSFEATKEKLIFVGHTHHPGRFELSGRQIGKYGSEDFQLEKGKRYIVNTGSVGEPRTPDIHASYCIYDSFQKKVIFRKLPFDIEGYKEDLLEVGLPIHPYFLDVYESGGGTLVHQPAELAMKRLPKIAALAAPTGRTQRVVVRKEGDPQVVRSFGSAAQAYRAAEAGQKGKGAAVWVVVSVVVALLAAVGIYALVSGDKEGGEDENGASAANGGKPQLEVGPIEKIPGDIAWSNHVVSGYKNLAREALITSDGNAPEWGSKGEAAVNDGDPKTFLKKVDGKGSYLVAARFNEPTAISALSLTGGEQNENAAADFDIYADEKKILSVRDAVYEDNQLLVAIPKISASVLELRISKTYGGAPAIRELGIYDWSVESDASGEPVVVVGGGESEKPEPAGEGEAEGGAGKVETAKLAPIEPHRPLEGSLGQMFFVPTAGEGSARWHYTVEAPLSDWMLPQFEPDERWKEGVAGFGNGNTYKDLIRTPWTTGDIWMRTRFEIPAENLDRARTWYLLLSHDNTCEVYLNGTKIFSPTNYNPKYVVALMPDGVKALLTGGVNVLAVHCKQESGNQFIDVGVVSIPGNAPIPGSGGGGVAVTWGEDSLLSEYRNIMAGSRVTRPDNHEVADGASGEQHVADGAPSTRWRGKPGRASYVLEIDFGKHVEMSGVSISAGDSGAPRDVEIKIGNQTFQASGLPYPENRQLIPIGRMAKTDKMTLTVKSWDGDAPEIRELGVYRLDEKGKKSEAPVPPQKPTTPVTPGEPVPPAPVQKVVKLQRGSEGFERVADVRIALGTVPGTALSTRGANMGGEPRLIVGTKEGQVNRVLMRVDIAGKFPEGKKLGDGKLVLSVVNGKKDEQVDLYLVHPKNGLWVEGKGRAAAGETQGGNGATWLSPDASGGNKWFGGDGLGEPGLSSGYLSRKANGSDPVSSGKVDDGRKVLEFTIPGEVMELWADPLRNTGILLRVPEEDAAADRQISVHSSESAEADKRPVLELVFEE